MPGPKKVTDEENGTVNVKNDEKGACENINPALELVPLF